MFFAGDGWSGRAEDCVLHGAIPVVIMDNADAVFETILDYSSFSIRISESQVILVGIGNDVVNFEAVRIFMDETFEASNVPRLDSHRALHVILVG